MESDRGERMGLLEYLRGQRGELLQGGELPAGLRDGAEAVGGPDEGNARLLGGGVVHHGVAHKNRAVDAVALQQQADVVRLAQAGAARVLKVADPVLRACLGRPNAGKSSLLNALAGYDRVIVTDVPGTTRDTVEETVRLGRVLLRLQDTAGIRDARDGIEAMGVQRSLAAAEEAQLALFVCDASQPLTPEDRQAIAAAQQAPQAIGVLNKQDLPAQIGPEALPFETVVSLSARDGTGLDALRRAVEARFAGDDVCDGSILTNARQAGAVRRAVDSLEAALGSLDAGMTPDAVLLDVEAAMQSLGELTGRTIRADITQRIFERFCVGK